MSGDRKRERERDSVILDDDEPKASMKPPNSKRQQRCLWRRQGVIEQIPCLSPKAAGQSTMWSAFRWIWQQKSTTVTERKSGAYRRPSYLNFRAQGG